MKTEIRIINYVDDILHLHKNKEYLKNMTQKVIETLIYFGFTMNAEKSETKPNQIVILLGWEWNLANATVKTKPKMRLLLLHDLNNMRRWIKTETEIIVKQTASLTLPEHNGPSERINCKTERMKYNEDNEQNGNPRYKLVDSEAQSEHSSTININTITNYNDNGCSTKWMGFDTRQRTGNDSNSSWNLEQKISEVNEQQQGNQGYNLRLTMFRQNLKKFANPILGDQMRQQHSSFQHQEIISINIINKGNQTSTLNNRKARNIDPDYSPPKSQKRNSRRTKQTIKNRGLQTKGEDFSIVMSSDELESNNRFILTTLQQSTAKIHVSNKRTLRNSN
ncbi:MAG: hypothetical protein EZS28_013019 [Streblomastix strix]|uniref:Reverse transcriptase domain-containing protein n=1 Tax=Streblomastix strix TaxID=222440 RepID=A0A5J4W965_9EUKA|nr:MAG: hypothetical protein EZS28_013019 [Streblomastix strix]